MKKNTLLFTLVISLLSIGSAYSQEVRMALQGGYGTEIERGAAGLGFEIFLDDKFSLAPGFNFYVPERIYMSGDKMTINVWEVVSSPFLGQL